ncbi:hypothetical protein [Gillisia sp. JM1]|jgi:predicted lysophospholipase L1 biosynthesis ABC-type transport system permease subunit|uniref:hypothetical protein n=1 Tax=Gillisia sp. JM1 TaxID=1283286 RepID=UPI0004177A84|nr:hypothetical protein [Gillisia sp. JM1]
MRNIYLYYIAILAPLAFLLYFMRTDQLNSWVLILGIIVYSIVYRTYIDGLRLVSKGIIERSDIWKMAYNGRRFQYFKELYFK